VTIATTLTSALPPGLDLRLRSRRPAKLADETLRYALDAPVPVVPVTAASPRVSIAVVTHRNLAFTKLCIASVLHNCDLPYELIVVDNASRDATCEYLHELAGANEHVRLIFNEDNRGFAAANNQALTAARGESLVLLNNDTIVPPGWLSRLVTHLDVESIGLVGPVTNRIGNEAEIEIDYQTYGQMLDLAATRACQHAGETTDLPRPAMFCLAMTRETFAKLGPLDEEFRIGMFEDDDYAMRARVAGLRCACAEGVFVHHFGEASFGDLFAGGARQALFEANRERFERKWNTTWQPMSRRRSPAQESLNARIAAAARDALPPGARVAVVSKGDETLLGFLRQDGFAASHFPASSDDAAWAGHHPADSAGAIKELARARADYLLVPQASAWWLGHYRDFFVNLGQPILATEGSCTIFQIRSKNS
jgi:GT2 family glycosyltransferase